MCPACLAPAIAAQVLKTQYAVRGELYLRAEQLRREGREIIFTNVGNPHALGAKPLTFTRQVRREETPGKEASLQLAPQLHLACEAACTVHLANPPWQHLTKPAPTLCRCWRCAQRPSCWTALTWTSCSPPTPLRVRASCSRPSRAVWARTPTRVATPW